MSQTALFNVSKIADFVMCGLIDSRASLDRTDEGVHRYMIIDWWWKRSNT
jgi:hypothetical protein